MNYNFLGIVLSAVGIAVAPVATIYFVISGILFSLALLCQVVSKPSPNFRKRTK